MKQAAWLFMGVAIGFDMSGVSLLVFSGMVVGPDAPIVGAGFAMFGKLMLGVSVIVWAFAGLFAIGRDR